MASTITNDSDSKTPLLQQHTNHNPQYSTIRADAIVHQSSIFKRIAYRILYGKSVEEFNRGHIILENYIRELQDSNNAKIRAGLPTRTSEVRRETTQ